ncbi:hypothetical protein LMG28614_04326 [Paraburkholderia ultramafica]|uniref:Uncharacterized protein n=1 Tax=Paraburkholderia ultramafica TaxID=1544867 RepID=A0A6S7BMH2_9BURK|nr:hypothetical protein LMG28614_04326 [Paraburkholderia ultramafica]
MFARHGTQEQVPRFYEKPRCLNTAFTRIFLNFMVRKSVAGDQTMDLLYLIAIVAFSGLVGAFVVGCDKLRRAPGGRP